MHRPATAAFERGMAILVIGAAFLRVLQDFVGFVNFLEGCFGAAVIGIAVRMILHRLLAIGGFDFSGVSIAFHPKYFVIIAFGHLLSIT